MIIAIAIFTLSIFARNHSAQAPRTILDRESLTTSESTTTTNALTTALRTSDVPGGIAIVSDCAEDRRYVFAPSGSTLKDALDKITFLNPFYTWQLNDGVINVAPAIGDPSLLTVLITKLKVTKARSVDDVIGQILALPEVQRRIVELHLTSGYSRIGMRDLRRLGSVSQSKQRNYMLDLKHVTLREALNAVARGNGRGVWEYRERHCNGTAEFQLQFLVR